jgi:hypothetical protein
MTIDLKRYIVFQYDNKESNNVTLTGKAKIGTKIREKPFRDFLVNYCGWQEVISKEFRKENHMGKDVHVGSPYFSIPHQFYTVY